MTSPLARHLMSTSRLATTLPEELTLLVTSPVVTVKVESACVDACAAAAAER